MIDLQEKCKTDMECSSAFSECSTGGCRCKKGFQRDGKGGCKPISESSWFSARDIENNRQKIQSSLAKNSMKSIEIIFKPNFLKPHQLTSGREDFDKLRRDQITRKLLINMLTLVHFKMDTFQLNKTNPTASKTVLNKVSLLFQQTRQT